jgi:hypothetical protein
MKLHTVWSMNRRPLKRLLGKRGRYGSRKCTNNQTANTFNLHFVCKWSRHVFDIERKNTILTTLQSTNSKIICVCVCVCVCVYFDFQQFEKYVYTYGIGLRHYASSSNVAHLIPSEVVSFFNWSHSNYGLAVDLASNRNEYQRTSRGQKAAGA